MLRLGVIEFFHDIISMDTSSTFTTLSDMYVIWETSFWQNKSFADPPTSIAEMQRLTRKVKTRISKA